MITQREDLIALIARMADALLRSQETYRAIINKGLGIPPNKKDKPPLDIRNINPGQLN